MDSLSYGQQIDERCGLVFPWYTPPMIEKLKTWDLKDKRVFEFGAGWSTAWWNYNAKAVYSVDHNRNWIEDINAAVDKIRLATPNDFIGKNNTVMYAPVVANEVELKSEYVQSIYKFQGEFDIIVVDGCFRDECVAAALTKIKDGGIIICDNWDQDFVWDSIMAGRLLDGFEHEIFVDPGHKDHVGRPWKTGYWIIDKGKESKVEAKNLLITYGDYDSHRPMLWMALEHIKPMNGGERSDVLELGCGYGSTPLLERYCEMQKRIFLSLESSHAWAEKFDNVLPVGNWETDSLEWIIRDMGLQFMLGVAFIDNAPGETRKDLIRYFANTAKIVIVHDTEDGAEHDYKMAASLNEYKYRCDLVIEGSPRTTAVSNVYDFERWKGLTLGKFKFV